MKLEKKVTHQGPIGKYRIRRFHCDLCDHTETIYAEGRRDLNMEPKRVIDDVNKMYRQQEDNCNYGYAEHHPE